ncbi:DUF1786 domain-containing protein [Thermovibrio ammonificans]
MKILLVDVGAGTQDLLLPIEGKSYENWVKAVLPSPTAKLAKAVDGWKGSVIRFNGYTMGGGPLKKAVLRFISRGGRVVATLPAAKSFSDDPNELKEWGIEVVESLPEADFTLTDLEFDLYRALFEMTGVEGDGFILGVACQDHGFEEGQSDRVTRFNYLRELLEEERRPEKLVYRGPTGKFSRFDSILEQLKERGVEGFVMDSKLAAVAGVLQVAREQGVKSFLCLDCGNGHTLAAAVKDGVICALFEHHTRMLGADKLKNFMVKLLKGELSFEEVFNDGGHGAVCFEPVEPEKVYLVGPNRKKFKELGEYAYPLGDAMLFGCAGLVEASRSLHFIS